MVFARIPGQPEQIALPSDRTPGEFIYSFMSAGGGTSLNTDGSTSAVTFSYTVPSNRSAHISRMNMCLFDSGQRPSKFGAQTALPTGCRLISTGTDGAEIFDFCDGRTIKRNADFGLFAGVDNETDSSGDPADDVRYVRWTIEKAGHPLLLRGGESIAMLIQDDLTTMADFQIFVQGVLLPV